MSEKHEAYPKGGGPVFDTRCGCGGLCDSNVTCPMLYNVAKDTERKASTHADE